MLQALALVAVGAAGAAAPTSPSPSPPPTIASVRASPLCSLLHGVVVPFLTMERDNHELFGEIDENMHKYYEAAQISDDEGSPGMILGRANVDWYSAQAYDNLARMDLLLKSSYERTPKGKDAAVDAVRDRMQTLVDIERIRINEYDSIAGQRTTSFNYWKSTTAEIARLQSAGAADPPPRAYASRWLADQMTIEQHDFVQPALHAVDICGAKY